MTRYFRFNGFFEEELKTGHLSPEKLDSKNKTLENLFYLFQSIVDPGTTMLLGEEPDPSWKNFWKSRGIQLTDIQFLKRNSQKNLQIDSKNFEGSTLEEWGAVANLEPSGEILHSPSKADLSKRVNSKIVLSRWKSENGFQDIPAEIIEKPSYLLSLLSEWSELRPDSIVLKPEFSFSGRHKILKISSLAGQDPETFVTSEKDLSWFPCVVEAWVQRTYDFSCLYDFLSGVPTFLGTTVQICDEKGKYNGAFLTSQEESDSIASHLNPIAEFLSKTFAPEYSGPVSLDGFEFHSQNSVKMRRLSEGNFRWSMGRILWELSQSKILRESKLLSGKALAILPLLLKKPIPNYSEWISSWGKTQGVEILPLTPDRFSSGKSYGTAWILLEFSQSSSEKTKDQILTFYAEWRKKILF
ncbi:hypothetical protein AB3N59_01365 [Leptospira sp. WS92.C1]